MPDVYAGFTVADLLILFLVFSFAASLQGALGYGMALIAAPIAVLINPDLIPGPLMTAALVLIFLMVLRDKQALDFLGLRWALAGMVPGTILGSLVLAALPTGGLVTLFAVLVLVAVVMSVAGLPIRPQRLPLLTGGLFSGFMGVIATLSGPPIALVYQNADGKRLRATMSAYFIVASAVSISSLLAVGEFGVRDLQLSLILVPGIVAGYFLSSHIVPYVDRGYTRPAVLTLSAVAALVILGRLILL